MASRERGDWPSRFLEHPLNEGTESVARLPVSRSSSFRRVTSWVNCTKSGTTDLVESSLECERPRGFVRSQRQLVPCLWGQGIGYVTDPS